ncbi:MAG: MmgE/PrpD family protein [Tetrasphaera sp.]
MDAPTEDPMGALCRFAVETRFGDLPPDVVEHAQYTLLDSMAVLIGGSAMEGVPAIIDLVKARGGAPESLLPFYGGRVPAAEAALALGPMPRAMDCGDLHEEAGHISEYVLSALLAATGLVPRVTGQQFLTAFVIGQETLVRIGAAYGVISSAIPAGDCGGHYILGAVAAVGSLLGLSREELLDAQGIARTMTQPHTMAIYAPATLMVRVHHGLVCQAAITACQLAQRGITGPREVLAGPTGLLTTARWDTRPEFVTADLGTTWQATRITTKRHSACYFSHSSIDGILEQMTTHGFSADDIASIHLDISQSGWLAVCEPVSEKWEPRTVPQCQFSLPYVVAVAAHDGRVFVESYSATSRERGDVRELMTRISASVDPTMTSWGARVTTRLRDGRSITTEHNYVKGHPDLPLDRQDYIDKFWACVPYSAMPLPSGVGEQLIRDVLSMRDVQDLETALLMPLTPPTD